MEKKRGWRIPGIPKKRYIYILHTLIRWFSIRSKVKVSLYQFPQAIPRNYSPFIWPGGIESTERETKTLLIQPYPWQNGWPGKSLEFTNNNQICLFCLLSFMACPAQAGRSKSEIGERCSGWVLSIPSPSFAVQKGEGGTVDLIFL